MVVPNSLTDRNRRQKKKNKKKLKIARDNMSIQMSAETIYFRNTIIREHSSFCKFNEI